MSYMKMTPGAMLEAVGDDAQKWADAFAEQFPQIDRETMFGWFANAIEHSSDVRFWRLVKSADALADHIERIGHMRSTYGELGLLDRSKPEAPQ